MPGRERQAAKGMDAFGKEIDEFTVGKVVFVIQIPV